MSTLPSALTPVTNSDASDPERKSQNNLSRGAQIESLQILFDLMGINGPREKVINLLHHYGSLSALMHADVITLDMAGINDDKLLKAIKAIKNILIIQNKEIISSGLCINSLNKLKNYAFNILRAKPTESLIVLFFDTKWQIARHNLRYEGNFNEVKMVSNDIIRVATYLRSSYIAIIHNHPSGDPSPSSTDLSETQLLARQLALLDIAIMDHIIVGHNSTFSFREEKCLH